MLVLAACSREVEAPEARWNPSESQAMVTSEDFSALYVAGGDDDVVVRIDAETLAVSPIALLGEPTRVTRIRDRLLVTLRAARAVVELKDDGAALTVVRRVEVGPEPFGIAATEDGARVYVAVSMAGQVLELDGGSLETLRTWTIPNEPRWLSLHPSDATLYVGGMGIGGLYAIDLERGTQARIELREARLLLRGGEVAAVGRVTGDPAASPTGTHLAVPMLYVDNGTPAVERRGGYYGGRAPSRINPVVAILPTTETGQPLVDDAELVLAAEPEAGGYLASVTFTPDGERIFATVEGGSHYAMLPTKRDVERDTEVAAVSGFDPRPVHFLSAPAGPRSVAFTTHRRGFVYGFIARRVLAFSFPDFDNLYADPREPLRRYDLARTERLGSSRLPEAVERGRRLFYATNDDAVTAGGVSCATCHFDGRTDGLTWSFERGPRQTPSLAGMVSLLEPVRWEADRATVADDALETSRSLMGGRLRLHEAQDLAAFIDYTRAVDHPLRGETNAEIELGREIFHRPEVGCATCHAGPLYTDKRIYDMLGFDGVKTPSLLGVVATAPYFHDGSAPDLASVLLVARTGLMGNTSTLDEVEMAALEAFLRSL